MNKETLEQFYGFMQGNGYYALITTMTLVSIGTNVWAIKKALQNLYYLNLFIGIVLIIIAGYVLYQYQNVKAFSEKTINDLAIAFELSEERKKQALEYTREKINSEIGIRSIILGVVFILIAIFTLYGAIKKLFFNSQ